MDCYSDPSFLWSKFDLFKVLTEQQFRDRRCKLNWHARCFFFSKSTFYVISSVPVKWVGNRPRNYRCKRQHLTCVTSQRQRRLTELEKKPLLLFFALLLMKKYPDLIKLASLRHPCFGRFCLQACSSFLVLSQLALALTSFSSNPAQNLDLKSQRPSCLAGSTASSRVAQI